MLQTFAFILIAALIAHLVGPWWAFAPVCVAAGIMFPVGVVSSFLGGFLAMVVLWGAAMAQVGFSSKVAMTAAVSLPTRMAQLLGVGGPMALGTLVALLAGLLGGIAALGGGSLRNYLFPKRSEMA